MLKMNLQLFAHKKGVGSTKNGRDSESKAEMIPCLLWQTASFVSRERAETKSRFLYIRRQSTSKTDELHTLCMGLFHILKG